MLDDVWRFHGVPWPTVTHTRIRIYSNAYARITPSVFCAPWCYSCAFTCTCALAHTRTHTRWWPGIRAGREPRIKVSWRAKQQNLAEKVRQKRWRNAGAIVTIIARARASIFGGPNIAQSRNGFSRKEARRSDPPRARARVGFRLRLCSRE